MALPAGEQWGVIGKYFDHIFVYQFYNIFVIYQDQLNSCSCVDVGPMRPAARPRAVAGILVGEVVGRTVLRDLDIAETLVVLQDQIKGLTLGI